MINSLGQGQNSLPSLRHLLVFINGWSYHNSLLQYHEKDPGNFLEKILTHYFLL